MRYASIIQTIGLVCVASAAWVIAVPAGLLVTGLTLVIVGVALERE